MKLWRSQRQFNVCLKHLTNSVYTIQMCQSSKILTIFIDRIPFTWSSYYPCYHLNSFQKEELRVNYPYWASPISRWKYDFWLIKQIDIPVNYIQIKRQNMSIEWWNIQLKLWKLKSNTFFRAIQTSWRKFTSFFWSEY